MKSGQALQTAAKILQSNKFEDYHIEARVLLGHVLGQTSTEIYTKPEFTLSHAQRLRFSGLIERRLLHEPVPYLTGHTEFFGNDFAVSKNVLIPRPETEILVEEAIKWISEKKGKAENYDSIIVADIGTGSGVIAISIAICHSDIKIVATDISKKALVVARKNCKIHRLGNQISLSRGSLLKPLHSKLDLIVSNLPYIEQSELPHLSPEITRFEPALAFDGGPHGLEIISNLLKDAKGYLKVGGCILLEIGAGQTRLVSEISERYLNGANFSTIKDYSGIERVTKIQT
jgi:release factor glutamine methyltransferase